MSVSPEIQKQFYESVVQDKNSQDITASVVIDAMRVMRSLMRHGKFDALCEIRGLGQGQLSLSSETIAEIKGVAPKASRRLFGEDYRLSEGFYRVARDMLRINMQSSNYHLEDSHYIEQLESKADDLGCKVLFYQDDQTFVLIPKTA